MTKELWAVYWVCLHSSVTSLDYQMPRLTIMQTKVFPEIDTTTATEIAQGLNASQKTHRSTIQGTMQLKPKPKTPVDDPI